MSPKGVAIYDPKDFIWTKSPYPKDVPCQISMHSGQWFKIYQQFPYFAPYWAPEVAALLFEQIWFPIPKHVSHQVWFKMAK